MAAFVIDHFVMSFLMVSVIFLALGPDFMEKHDQNNMVTTMLFVMIPGFMLYFAKDSVKGISVGKWMMGIMVRDARDPKEVPSVGRLFLRNLFVVIWPVEFIVLATSDEKRRLGDKVAKTVVLNNPDKPARLPRVLALVVVVVLFFTFTFFFAGGALKNSEAYKVAIREIDRNEQIIKETGGIEGYGMMPKGNISITNGLGQAQLEIKVLGESKDVEVHVYLEKEPDGPWKLIEIQK